MKGFFSGKSTPIARRVAAGAMLFILSAACAWAENWREADAAAPSTRDYIDADSLVRLRPDGQIFELRRKQVLARPEPSGASVLVELVAVDCESVGHVVMTQEWYDDAQQLRDKPRWSRTRADALHTLATDVLIRNREPRRAALTCQAVRAALADKPAREDFSAADVVPDKPGLPVTLQGRARPSGNAQDAPRIVAGQTKVGTAFFVAGDGTFVTAAHVVAACQAITIEAKGASAPARIISIDRTRDIALGRAKVTPRAHARFAADGKLRQGEQVVSFGFPLAGAVASGGNTNTGYVAALAGLRDDPTMLQVSVPIQPGNSGGPLVDLSGGVIGVIKGKLRPDAVFAATGALPENVNFAIKAAVVQEMMKGARIPAQVIEDVPPKSVADASEEMRLYTVRVTCR